jgi:hypothetical protein
LVNVGRYHINDMRNLAIGEAADDLQGYAAYFSAGAGIGLGGTIHSATGFKFVDGAKIPTLTLDTAGFGVGASVGGGFSFGGSYSIPVIKP